MPPLATSTFFEVVLASLIIIPLIILWVAAVVDVFSHEHSGLRIAGLLVLILAFPILGPLLYFIFRKPMPASADAAQSQYLAEADRRREAAGRPVGGAGMYR
jgi:hypothetical protein